MSATKFFIATLLSLSAIYGTEASEALVPKVTLCTASNFGGTCLDVPVPHSTCVNFDGGRTILNKELSSAKIPKGIACNFFEHYGCTGSNASSATDTGAATGGDWPTMMITGIWARQNFNDVVSSIICSPI